MNLLQMSFSGAAFITAVVIIRAVAINKLPKKTFLVLWEFHHTLCYGFCRIYLKEAPGKRYDIR